MFEDASLDFVYIDGYAHTGNDEGGLGDGSFIGGLLKVAGQTAQQSGVPLGVGQTLRKNRYEKPGVGR